MTGEARVVHLSTAGRPRSAPAWRRRARERAGTLLLMVYGGAYAVFAILCGIGAGLIGKGRGQSFWIWFSIGLILPLFGNIAAALSRNENDEPRRQCPRCKTVTMAYAAQCMKCGGELPFPSEDEMLPSVNELRMIRAAQESP